MPYGQPFYTYPNGGYTPVQQQGYGMYQPQQQMPSTAQNQPYTAYQQQPQVNAQPQATMPPKTNVPFATNLMDAMSRSAEFNTETFYADQDKPFIYRVSIDMQGRKTYRTFELKDVTEQVVDNGSGTSAQNIDLSDYATKRELQAFREELMNYAASLGLGASTAPSAPNIPPKARRSKDIEE